MTIYELFAKILQEIHAGRGHYRVMIWDANESVLVPAAGTIITNLSNKQLEFRMED
jgi:3'-phosphoadenosine 5'-phosphosulfate (PAPS) 3'-phosphatase